MICVLCLIAKDSQKFCPQKQIHEGISYEYLRNHGKQAFIPLCFNTLRPRQNGRLFADDTFKRIFLNENVWIPIKISLKFVPKGPINNIPALVQIMAWRRPGDKPLSEPMLVWSLTHICITRPQWVKDPKEINGSDLIKLGEHSLYFFTIFFS